MNRIPKQTGVSFELAAGRRLVVVDPEGGQVADLVAFDADDRAEWLSSGRTIDYANRIYLSEGDILYSNRSRPMLTIARDDVGRHDFLLTPCSQDTFDILYDWDGHHPSCFENLVTNLSRFGIDPDAIPTTFNIFMNVQVGEDGVLDIAPPLSKPGDRIEFEAHRDLVVGLTACSAEKTNDGSLGPIEWAIVD